MMLEGVLLMNIATKKTVCWGVFPGPADISVHNMMDKLASLLLQTVSMTREQHVVPFCVPNGSQCITITPCHAAVLDDVSGCAGMGL